MALNLQDKQAIVAEVSEVAKGALSAVVADSRGVTVDKMTELRKAGREAGVYMRVVRNTLLRRAVDGGDLSLKIGKCRRKSGIRTENDAVCLTAGFDRSVHFKFCFLVCIHKCVVPFLFIS